VRRMDPTNYQFNRSTNCLSINQLSINQPTINRSTNYQSINQLSINQPTINRSTNYQSIDQELNKSWMRKEGEQKETLMMRSDMRVVGMDTEGGEWETTMIAEKYPTTPRKVKMRAAQVLSAITSSISSSKNWSSEFSFSISSPFLSLQSGIGFIALILLLMEAYKGGRCCFNNPIHKILLDSQSNRFFF